MLSDRQSAAAEPPLQENDLEILDQIVGRCETKYDLLFALYIIPVIQSDLAQLVTNAQWRLE